jgi:hypothetical protein
MCADNNGGVNGLLQNKATDSHAIITSTKSSAKENGRYVRQQAKPTAQANVQKTIRKQEYSHCGVY